jgi:phosphoglycerol transferase MdoB-like AlkP superfamily enzyme
VHDSSPAADDELTLPTDTEMGKRLRVPPSNWATWLSVGAVLALLLQEQRVLSTFGGEGSEARWTPALMPLVVVGVALLTGTRWRWRVLSLLGFAWSLVLLADRAYAEYFHQPINFRMTSGLGQLWDVRHSIVALVQPYDLAMLVSWIVLGVFAWRRRAMLSGSIGRSSWATGALLAVAGTAGLVHAGVRASALEIPALGGSVGAYAREFGLGWYHLRDVWGLLGGGSEGRPLDDEQRERILGALLHKERLNATDSPLFGVARGRNVMLIQLEAFSHALRDLPVREGSVTPTLDRLAREGLFFERAMDTAGVGRTSDCEFQVLTGLRSHSTVPVAFAHTQHDYTTLATVMTALGGETRSYHGNRGGFWNRSVTHPNYGIARSEFVESFEATVPRPWGVSDADVFAQLPERLAALDARFVALLISLSSHHPFRDVPAAVADWPVPAKDGSMLAGYLRLAHFTDAALGDFMQRMHDAGLAERTLFVIYGDHDPGLDADGRRVLGERLGRDLDHPAERRVPLLFVAPGAERELAAGRGAAAKTVATFADIAPTVLHLLGEPVPLGMYGTHLFVPPVARDLVALGEQQGFARGDTVHTLHDDLRRLSPKQVAALDASAREAQRERVLIDLILDHGGQALAAEFDAAHPPGDAERERLIALAERPTDDALPPDTPRRWSRAHDGGETPLPDGARLVMLMSPNTAFVRTELALRNPGARDASALVIAYDAAGKQLWFEAVELPADGNASLDPAGRAGGWPAYLMVGGPADITAAAVARHPRGVLLQPSIDTTADAVVLGDRIGTDERSYVFLVNLADEMRTATISVTLDDERMLPIEIELPPGERALHHLELSPRGAGEVRIRVAAPDVAVDAIHWAESPRD